MRLACDTGGTFTDLLVEEADGTWLMTKASTVLHDPILGVLAALQKAADIQGRSLTEFLSRAELFIHGTTHALNAILTGNTASTALLTTRGHRDILLLREGGRTGPFAFDLPYPKPYVPRALTFEVTERIDSTGAIRIELDEQEVRTTCDRLRELGVDAVAVCLLWSIVNPKHELEVGKLLAKHLPGIPVTLSHSISSALREYRRASAAAVDASLKPLMTKYLGLLAERLSAAGFNGQLLVSTSQGGMLPASSVAESPILSINSGPAMAPVAGRWYGANIDAIADVVVADSGGTTFDVSLVRDGRIPLTREAWIGGAHRGPMTGFPSVDVRSVGAGGGSIASVDSGGLVRVGPQSAGAWPGPACYGRGGTRPTISDAALILGILSSEHFLDGSMSLDRDASMRAMSIHVANPMGISVETAASIVLRVATETMAQATLDLLTSQGVDPRKALLVMGGGAAGLNAIFIARRLGCRTLIIPEAGAALSATGAMLSDLKREVRAMQFQTTRAFDRASAARAFTEMVTECDRFAAEIGAATSTMAFSAEARYPDQVWELELPLRNIEFGPDAPQVIEADFHQLHERLFEVSDPASGVEIIGWAASVSCRSRPKNVPHLQLPPAREPDHRRVTFLDGTSAETIVYDYSWLETGKRFNGPALVEMPLTTVLVDSNTTHFSREVSSLVIGLDK
jgi:N-methylhydantoinase A